MSGGDHCELPQINIDQPRYNQYTYWGRARHFFEITNPLNLFASASALENARAIVLKYRCKEPLPECITEEELWRAKSLYDSAYHPDTGEKMMLIGRMSAQVPMNMLITGGMVAFYKTVPAIIFWQWINQSFNALVNYTNRSGDAPLTDKQILASYIVATGGAVATAIALNKVAERSQSPLLARLVPFIAVSAANCVNIPCMRAQELKEGTPVFDSNENRLGNSKIAAQQGIKQVILSRVAMAAPGMVLAPFIMNHLERRGTLCRYPWMAVPLQLAIIGLCLTFATPLACAVFKQRAELRYCDLELELREKTEQRVGKDVPYMVFYNKGL